MTLLRASQASIHACMADSRTMLRIATSHASVPQYRMVEPMHVVADRNPRMQRFIREVQQSQHLH